MLAALPCLPPSHHQSTIIPSWNFDRQAGWTVWAGWRQTAAWLWWWTFACKQAQLPTGKRTKRISSCLPSTCCTLFLSSFCFCLAFPSFSFLAYSSPHFLSQREGMEGMETCMVMMVVDMHFFLPLFMQTFERKGKKETVAVLISSHSLTLTLTLSLTSQSIPFPHFIIWEGQDWNWA